jgi:hypothetical protein
VPPCCAGPVLHCAVLCCGCVQAEYRRLYGMYEELKRQKIKELEGLVEEQEAYVTRMGKVGGGGGGRGMAARLAGGVRGCACAAVVCWARLNLHVPFPLALAAHGQQDAAGSWSRLCPPPAIAVRTSPCALGYLLWLCRRPNSLLSTGG